MTIGRVVPALVVCLLLIAPFAVGLDRPDISSLQLNSSLRRNTVSENLTAYVRISDIDGVRNVTTLDWRINGTSIASLHMSFNANDTAAVGKTRDYSTYGNNGTLFNTTVWNATGGLNSTGGLSFGSSGWVNITPINLSGTLTITYWANTVPRDELSNVVLGNSNNLTGNAKIGFINNSGTFRVFVRIVMPSTSDTSVTAPTSGWHHYAVRRDASNKIDLFVDGTKTRLFSDVAQVGQFVPEYIGASYPYTEVQYYKGHLDDLRIYNRSLSDAQVQQIAWNRSDLIVQDELAAGQHWSVCATPFDGNDSGATLCTGILRVEPSVDGRSNINITGTINASQFYERGSTLLTNDISGNAASAGTAMSASDLSCTNCADGEEIEEMALSGTAASLIAGNISCTDCIDTSQLLDSYFLNSGDSGTAEFTFDSGTFTTEYQFLEEAFYYGFNDSTPSELVDIKGTLMLEHTYPIIMNDSATTGPGDLWRLSLSGGNLTFEQNNATARDFSAVRPLLHIKHDGTALLGGDASRIPASVWVGANGSNVTIGNRQGLAKLHILQNSTADDVAIHFSNTTQNWTFGVDTSTGLLRLEPAETLGAGIGLAIRGNQSASVGINMPTPNATLDVNGSVGIATDDALASIFSQQIGYAQSYQLVVQGKYAYVISGTDDDIFFVLDIQDPRNLLKVGVLQNSTYLNESESLAVQGKYAYVGYSSDGASQDGITVIDISNPAMPALAGAYVFPSSDTPAGLTVHGAYLYAALRSSDTLAIFDVSNPANITPIGTFTNTTSLDGIREVRVHNGIAYATSITADSLTVINVTDPRNPKQLSWINGTSLDGANGLDILGRYVFVAAGAADNITVVDVKNLNSLTIAETFNHTSMDKPEAITVSGNRAYVHSTTSYYMTVLDISTPTDIKFVDAILGAQQHRSPLEVAGRYMYSNELGTTYIRTIDLGGMLAHAAEFGALEAGNIDAQKVTVVGTVETEAAFAGPQGLFTDGPVAIGGRARNVVPTMYLSDVQQAGSHACSTAPSTCCMQGYHMCTPSEWLYGGRQIETTGRGRYTTPFFVSGWVNPSGGSNTTDCANWTSASAGDAGYYCRFTTSQSCYVTSSESVYCNTGHRTWCCSD